jgi:3-hydroxyacyl-CoA dehydrogenase
MCDPPFPMRCRCRCADRIVGAHFFSPAHVMPLLEIVRTPATSKQVRCREVYFLGGGEEAPRLGSSGCG